MILWEYFKINSICSNHSSSDVHFNNQILHLTCFNWPLSITCYQSSDYFLVQVDWNVWGVPIAYNELTLTEYLIVVSFARSSCPQGLSSDSVAIDASPYNKIATCRSKHMILFENVTPSNSLYIYCNTNLSTGHVESDNSSARIETHCPRSVECGDWSNASTTLVKNITCIGMKTITFPLSFTHELLCELPAR